MFELPVKSVNFPTGRIKKNPTAKTLPAKVDVTMAKLCWAALTVGRPDKLAVKAFGAHSIHEAKYRWNMVRAALDFSKVPKRASNSALFDALDPTEKGGINFYLGMIFAKICAHDLLGIPWLVHYGWMKKKGRVTTKAGSKSTPDLLGFHPLSGKWSVFEAKGRSAGYNNQVMVKAIKQAERVSHVDGKKCDLHVGTQLYRTKAKSLMFRWEDPVPDDRNPIELESGREVWQQYYGLVYALYLEQRMDRAAFIDQMGFGIKLEQDLVFFLEVLFSDNSANYDNVFGEFMRWSAINSIRTQDGANADGINIIWYREP